MSNRESGYDAIILLAGIDIADNGGEYIVIDFHDPIVGDTVRGSWSLATEKSIGFVKRVLRHLGWEGNNILTLDTLAGKPAFIRAYTEEYNGKTQQRVDLPRLQNGFAGAEPRGSVDAKRALAESLKGAFADGPSGSYQRPSARAAVPSPRPTQHRTSAVNGQLPPAPILGPGDGYEPPMGDDDIPF